MAVPYDITKISVLADEIEVAWHKMLLLHHEKLGRGRSPQVVGRSRAAVIRRLRTEIADAGAGPKMPEFDVNATGGIRTTGG